MDEGDADACYEIQTEADVEYVTGEVDPNAAAEADAPKDNGEVLSTDESKKEEEKKPVDVGDAEADEHDFVAMPSMKVVSNDLSSLNALKCFFVYTLSVDDLDHPTITSLLRNPACSDVKLQFSRSSDDESTLLGVMSVSFSSSKQAAAVMSSVGEMRSELTVEPLQPTHTMNSVVAKWKKDNAIANKPVTGAMVIVKNLDAEAATVEKLTELFPDAEDITVSSQPQASYLGKLKGTKHAYLVFPDKQSADAVVEQANAYPVEFNGRMLIVRHYTEPPNHVPKGYMRLTTRKLVLRQIAHARGLIARAQEDPTYDMPAVWRTRLTSALELIEKDDEARDILGLSKPSLMDFQDINLKQMLTQRDSANILFNLGIGDDPGVIFPSKTMKRPIGQIDAPSELAAKIASRGSRGGGKPLPLLSHRLSQAGQARMRGPSRGVMFRMRGRVDRLGGFGMDAMSGGPSNYPLPSPRILAMRARARAMYLGW